VPAWESERSDKKKKRDFIYKEYYRTQKNSGIYK
jgi:hypothetical protein